MEIEQAAGVAAVLSWKVSMKKKKKGQQRLRKWGGDLPGAQGAVANTLVPLACCGADLTSPVSLTAALLAGL